MKITFPHLGDAYIAVSLMCKEMGIECCIPTLNNIETLEKGSKYSPEEICLPFKLMVGNLMDGIDQGADTVVMVASGGPCRLGEYGELLKSVLDKNEYKVRWVLLDTISDIGIRELLKRLGSIWQGKRKNRMKLVSSSKAIYTVIKLLEDLERKAHWLCGYEVGKGTVKKILYQCKSDVFHAENIYQANEILNESHKQIDKVPVDRNKMPAKVVLTGEIYSLIEPFSNQYLEDKLMDMGVSFYKRITIGWWIDTTVVKPIERSKAVKKKNAYLDYCIGGYAKDTIEEVLKAKGEGYDGVIQLLPLGCMPEIVAKAVISEMSQELNIKVLTVVFDEMNGEAGYMTRVEAFIDMLQRRKPHVLYGY